MEVTILVKKSQEARYNLDPGSFFVNCFWGRRLDWVAINEALKIVYILEFKRSTDWDERFLEVKDAEANEQHKSIIGPLKTAAPSGNLRRLPLWWAHTVTVDWWLRAANIIMHVTLSQFCLYLLHFGHFTYTFHMQIQRHTHTGTHVQSAHKRNGDNQAQEPG